MMVPGVPVRIRDAYVGGVGTLHAEVFGLVPVVDMPRTPELARGELMRFFAEQGRFRDYVSRSGMRIPLEGEADWILPEGVKPYWRGTTTAMTHEFVP